MLCRRYSSGEEEDDPQAVYKDSDGVWHVKKGKLVKVELTMTVEYDRFNIALVDKLVYIFLLQSFTLYCKYHSLVVL